MNLTKVDSQTSPKAQKKQTNEPYKGQFPNITKSSKKANQ
jgi:hypothetical protein